MTGSAHFFGIRHHGPGSSRALLQALDALEPLEVLIEGPADASDLLPMLANPAMVPPVALLTYPADAPSEAVFWPSQHFPPNIRWSARRCAAACRCATSICRRGGGCP